MLLNILSASRTNDDHYIQSLFVAPKNETNLKKHRIKLVKHNGTSPFKFHQKFSMSIKMSQSGPESGIDRRNSDRWIYTFLLLHRILLKIFITIFYSQVCTKRRSQKRRNVRRNDVRAGSSPWNMTEIQYNVTTRSVSPSSSVPPAPPRDAFL